MVSFNLALLTLSATTALAIPHMKHQKFHASGFYGSGHLRPTGDATTANSTGIYGGETTVTLTQTETISSDTVSTQAALNLAADEPSCTDSTSTCIETSVEYVYVTARDAQPEAQRWSRTSRYGGGNYATTTPAADGYGATGYGTASATASGVSATASAVAGALSGGKKGLAYNTNSLLSMFSGSSWAYNWASTAGGIVPSGMEFVPMIWGAKSVAEWPAAIKKSIDAGAKAVLSFNEPDHGEQASMSVSDCVSLHVENVSPYADRLKIGSPGVTNSGSSSQGLSYLGNFLKQCRSSGTDACKLDFLAIHWYADASNDFSIFTNHIQAAIKLGNEHFAVSGKPTKVWLTEFANQGSASSNAEFVTKAINYLESTPEVERYSYFMAAEGQMINGGALNAIGKAYIS